jgi:hypothetical protein
MSTTLDDRNGTTSFAGVASAILFVLMLGTGYTMAPKVEGAVDSPVAAEEQEIVEAAFLPSDCAVDGLVFVDCNLAF